jgi:C-terminal processing protease CtpA/Prc
MPKERQTIEITITGGETKKKQAGDGSSEKTGKMGNNTLACNIIEKGGTGEKRTQHKYYYGIGIAIGWRRNDLLINGEYVPGTEIVQVVPGYPAEENGLLVGDYIISFNGTPYQDSLSPLRQEVDDGKMFELVIYRNGQLLTFRMRRAKIFYD